MQSWSSCTHFLSVQKYHQFYSSTHSKGTSCFILSVAVGLSDSSIKLRLAKVWQPADTIVGRCRCAPRGQWGPTVAWQQPGGTAVGTPQKVTPAWLHTPSNSEHDGHKILRDIALSGGAENIFTGGRTVSFVLHTCSFKTKLRTHIGCNRRN